MKETAVGDGDLVPVQVAYALPQVQRVISVDVPKGATIEDAIRASGILDEFPEIDLATQRVGVFGKLSTLDAEVRRGDRIEIYRPLIADPKEVRRRRAAQKRSASRQ